MRRENLADERSEVEPHKGADHEHIAVGKINEAQDAIDHGIAQRDQRINRTQCKAVDQLLKEFAHRGESQADKYCQRLTELSSAKAPASRTHSKRFATKGARADKLAPAFGVRPACRRFRTPVAIPPRLRSRQFFLTVSPSPH